jgi:hypothetical protein
LHLTCCGWIRQPSHVGELKRTAAETFVMRALAVAGALICLTTVGHAQEKSVVELNSIRMYLPDEDMRERVGDDATPLGNYVKALQKEAAAFWQNASQPKAKGLLVAVGVKPGKNVRVWCDPVDGEIPAETLAKLERKLGEVPAVAVRRGPIAFALEIKLWGQQPKNFPEAPKAWVDAAKKAKEPLTIPDSLFKVVWAE